MRDAVVAGISHNSSVGGKGRGMVSKVFFTAAQEVADGKAKRNLSRFQHGLRNAVVRVFAYIVPRI